MPPATIDADQPFGADQGTASDRSEAQLPVEILWKIYDLLDRFDFDAARQVCSSWYHASCKAELVTPLLEEMQASSALKVDQELAGLHLSTDGRAIEAPLYIKYKRFATECRLSASWRGSTFLTSTEPTTPRMIWTEHIDFTRLIPRGVGTADRIPEIFTLSACGEFVLLNTGNEVYVYSFYKSLGDLQLIATLSTESKVLIISMDSYQDSLLVGAALENESGALWKLKDVSYKSEPKPLLSTANVQDCDEDPPDGVHPDSYSSKLTNPASVAFDRGGKSSIMRGICPDQVLKSVGTGTAEVTSVAVHARASIVAFGFADGMTLYWDEAFRHGHFASHWHTHAPADHLYFLPEIQHEIAAAQLRLTSSPSVRSISGVSKPRKYLRSNLDTADESNLPGKGWLFWFDTSPVVDTAGRLSPEVFLALGPAAGSDHYHRKPLSDGKLSLFVDPITNLLCLGHNAPYHGHHRLIRVACLVPPAGNKDCYASAPVGYAAGADLRWGLRVVSVYADGQLVVFNVPSDVLAGLHRIQLTASQQLRNDDSLLYAADLSTDPNDENRIEMTSPNNTANPGFRALKIDGALISRLDKTVESLAVNSTGGGLKVWIFYRSGHAAYGDIYIPRLPSIRRRKAGPDGQLYAME